MKKITSLRVKKLGSISKDCVVVFLEKPQDFRYQSGDCVDISFVDAPHLGKQTYSLASSPYDQILMLAFKKGYSEFKHKLAALNPGENLHATQYGSNFIFDSKVPSIMIAGGIGVTPFRSMIRTGLIEHPSVQTTLLFQNRSTDFPFRDELRSWEKDYESLQIYWRDTDTKGRLTPEILKAIVEGKTNAFHYYVAGPPLMVDSTIELLTKLKIKNDSIHTDSFDGYLDEIS